MPDNSNPAPQSIEAKLDAIRRQFLSQYGSRIDQITELWQQAQREPGDLESLRSMHCHVHSLNGAAATFGLRSLSNMAETIEEVLDLALTAGGMSSDQRFRVEERLQSLTSVSFTIKRGSLEPLGASPLPKRGRRDDRARKRIYLVDDDPHVAEHLSLQIANFGYAVETFSNVTELARATREKPPHAFVVDVQLPEGDMAGVQAMAALRQENEMNGPVVFISSRQDLDARLEAVRAGADAYLVKPIDVGVLTDLLDNLLHEEEPEPYRVLIVEDDKTLAQHNATILEHAGMHTEIVTDPMAVLGPLKDWNPDLILMDLYMPGCTGFELASVIRQDEAYLSIPIVFLSSETNVNRQQAALRLGGDGFLNKSIDPEHLISSVATRAERLRMLRTLIVRDNLTGVYNHGAIMEQLGLELRRATRDSTPLAVALIDLDRFKSVNDQHGHTIGSRVIKSTARLLQKRLRKTDVVGRYGGEEFCVIFPGAEASDAHRRVDEIRNTWSRVTHNAASGDFQVTFSAGVAELKPGMETHHLLDAADQALYVAKDSGRNRAVLASSVPVAETPVEPRGA